ncbi:MAG TPA: serine hydrolase domain-containing protein [Terriglobales bacterium]|nr:serine hydrolase domain-containing protein [Terriglobales bacterium]
MQISPSALMSTIHGAVEPGYEEVRDEFQKNFLHRGEIGAACAAYVRGRKVVDLWGGFRDLVTRAPWEENTLVIMYSVTKGMAGLAMALAHSRGLFDYEEKVATYWPEFAQNGKQSITVRQLLSHQAGLCALDHRLNRNTVADFDRLATILARQKPAWDPGRYHGYHGITLGWYESELLRRVDPQHRTIGQFFWEEVARSLGLEFYIGTPAELPATRVAALIDYAPWRLLFHMRQLPPAFVSRVLNPFSLTHKTMRNPDLNRPGDLNLPEWRSVEVPAGNGVGQVRSVAKAYSEFATGGAALKLRPETLTALAEPAIPPTAGDFDQVLRTRTSYSMGFIKPFSAFAFAGHTAFAAPGLGGSMGYADPEAGMAFAYAPNHLGFYMWDDPRERALRHAVQRCAGRLRGGGEARASA